MRGKGRMVGEGMRGKQVGFVRGGQQRSAVVRGFHPQQPAGFPQIDEIHRCTDLGC